VASVRSEQKSQEILKRHPSWKDKVSFVYVSDINEDGAFDDVFASTGGEFDYIIHTASPVQFDVKDAQKDLIDPSVRGYT
jgi:hypothetical protein